jgi:hypothetical protein
VESDCIGEHGGLHKIFVCARTSCLVNIPLARD